VRRGRDFWRQLSSEVDRGERVVDVARRHRVQSRTLSWWRWKLRTNEELKAEFLPVVVRPPQPGPAFPIELRVGDLIIRVATDADVSYVAALVDALRGRC
jgi:transposase-like protein